MLQIESLKEHTDLIETCAAWDFAEWGCHMPHANMRDTIASFSRSAGDDALPITLVALVDGKAAGMVSLLAEDHPDYKHLKPWLSALYVHPKFRRQGIGEALCRKVVQQASLLNHEKIYLYTATAETLYQKLGWQALGTVKGPTGLLEDLMMLEVSSIVQKS